jgi:predicted nucleic acid-binding Zn ribbon protein
MVMLAYKIPPLNDLAKEEEIKVFSRQDLNKWKATVADNRKGKEKKRKRQFKIVIGPLSQKGKDGQTFQPMKGDQLCIKDQDLATKLNKNLTKVAFVEKESNVYQTLKRPSRKGKHGPG